MNTFNPTPNQYNKRNFYEVLKIITPLIYEQKDIETSGVAIDEADNIINSHILAANKMSSILFVSGYSNISSISQYFIKQNELTKITSQTFNDKILKPLGSAIDDFETNEDFRDCISSVILPKIRTNSNTLYSDTTGVYANTNSGTHYYLADNLGWFYFLNQSGLGSLVYEPSSYVLSQLSTLYLDNKLETLEGIIGLTKYLWYNYGTKAIISSNGLIPQNYVSGTSTYTSGTQQLDKLETMIEVLYSKAYADRQDFRIKNSFDDYINGLGLINDLESKGFFHKFYKAIGYSMADINNQIEQLQSLYDIDSCPDEFLPYIAQLIDWQLLGPDPVKWRHQLRTAVDIYKKKGTTQSIQYAMNALIKGVSLDVSSNVEELWESYLPFLLWYSLATESIHFKNLETWTRQKAQDAGIYNYDQASLENNIKIAVDHILLEAYKRFPSNFTYQGKEFPVYRMVTLDNQTAEPGDIYVLPFEKYTPIDYQQPIFLKSWYFDTDYRYNYNMMEVGRYGETNAFNASFHEGPSGLGIYLGKVVSGTNNSLERPIYLSSTGESSFVFNFRNYTNFPIPPFEEIKYYKYCDITKELLDFLVEKLKCLGVNDSFANYFSNYVTDSAINSNQNIAAKNSFLMFFSGMQIPTNYFQVLNNRDSIDNGIFSLWNGKSSHVSVGFYASSFDFVSEDYEGDGRYALQSTKTVLDKFLPAHAIPNINLEVSSYADNFTASNTEFDSVNFGKRDTMYSLSAGIFAGTEVSGLSMGAISPGTDSGRGGLNTFLRTDVNTVDDPLFSGTTYIEVPRKALRRRNYKFVLPHEQYYDRTGFNQPITFDLSVLERSTTNSSGILPLGYIPSSNSYYPVYDFRNPSSVWAFCENLDSDNQYFGVSVSNTFPARGLKVLGSDLKNYPTSTSSHDKYVDRCQVHPLFIVMQNIKEKEAISKAEIAVSANYQNYYGTIYKEDHVRSLANGYLNSGTVGINSYRDYEDFQFGRGIHLLFKDYKKYFNHSLGASSLENTGANIFSHTFGPTLYNADFSIQGSAVTTQEGTYIASSLDRIVPIAYSNGSGVFSVCAVQNGAASGTYVASTIASMVVPFNGVFSAGSRCVELRNPYILSGIEFVQTSGASTKNKFEILQLQGSGDFYLKDRPVIKCFTYNGLPRLRFDLSSYGTRANTLIPEHKFRFTFKGQVTDSNLNEIGGGKIGVWVHTGLITGNDGNSYFWSWTNRNRWELVKYNSLTMQIVKEELSIPYNFSARRPVDSTINIREDIKCLGNRVYDTITESFTERTVDSFLDFKEEYLDTFEFDFDTRNYTNYNNFEYLEIIPVPDIYHQIRKNVHGSDINYFVEVFSYPLSEDNKFVLIDTISIQDLTLKQNSGLRTGYGIQTSSIPLVPFVEEYQYYTDKEELRVILKFFNGLTTNSYTSRNASDSSGILNTSGGGRLNYRLHPGTTVPLTGVDVRN